MNEDKNPPNTLLITPPAEDSDDEGNNDSEPMIFNFGPQSNEEVRDQALQEATSFNFGPQPMEAPEVEFVSSLTTGSRKNQMPLYTKELGAFINNKRRAATNRELRGGATAYIDEDESGTYDPKKARRTPPSPSRPAKRVKTSNAIDEDGNPRPKKPTKLIGFRYSLVVKLDFKSEKALNYLRSLPAGTSGPQPGFVEEEVDSDGSGCVVPSKRKRQVKRPRRLGATASRSDGLTIDRLTTGHPQRRGCRCCFEQGNDDCSLIKYAHEYPCEACEDAGVDCVLIVPPKFKKVCLRCKEKRRNCSYILDGGKGVEACDACEEEGVTCCAEALTEPSFLRRFVNRPARIKPIPTPTKTAKEPAKERMFVACNQCRATGKRCTNRGKADPGPCSNCRKANQACKFVIPTTRTPQLQAPPSSSKSKRTFASSSRHHSKSASSTPARARSGTPHSPNTLTETIYSELEKKNIRKAEKLIAKGKLFSPSHPLYYGSRDNKSKIPQTSPKLIGCTLGISHIYIITSFCHPITFNYVPDPLLRNPCSWCDNPFFGLWGLASTSDPRKVEGFYHADGQGFEEVYGGFSEIGYSKSVMCIACTYARVRITQCPSHRIRALDPNRAEIDMRVFDDRKWGEAVDAYKAGDEKGAELVRSAKWCSVCPAAAALKCCSPQLFDENGEPVSQHGHGHGGGGCEGCGLLLCEDCAELMGKLIKGGARTGAKQLDAIVREVKGNKWRYAEGVRADAEFLTSAGELLRRIGQGMGASEGRLDDEGEVQVLKVEGEGGWIGGGFDTKERGREKEKGRSGWMNEDMKVGGVNGKVIGKGKEKADIAEKAWAQYQAREKEAERSSVGAGFKGKGKVQSNGPGGGGRANGAVCVGGRGTNGQLRQRTSTASSGSASSGARNGLQTNDRRFSSGSESTSGAGQTVNGFHSTQNSTDNRSMGPPSGTGFNNSQRAGSGRNGGGNGNMQLGVKREREERGEFQFGGLLKERKRDVERDFGGRMGDVIDLTDD
ncbi:hypothetical protein BKA61DRAFT_729218 [Leptodontidium sp. MPI-SDFR-AT-0119]|nr:hypothetical protein BKA61DRAFT_729218 [Leptodontidium sp. MPI-SDFR-AT-0119]